ncbi:MAG TPA: hypothetical protein VF668_16430 [Pyrinomonadaceae bacterium]|jgi:hypothetical protein
MNSGINRMYAMFVRVSSFADERAGAFPAGSLGAEAVAEVKTAVESLNEAGASQTSGLTSVHRATAERFAAREALREGMAAFARTARVMALDTPGLENKFRLPRSGSDPALLQTARAFAADALPLKDLFLRHEMPASFLEDFRQDIADLERAMGQQDTGRGAHVSATATVESAAERGMNAVRRLDAIVRNKFRDDPAARAAWESARHVESAPRRRQRGDDSAGAGGVGDGKPA